MFTLGDDDAGAAMADLSMVPKDIALDRGTVSRDLDSAAVAELKLGAVAAIAEQRAGIVAATDGIIAGREILEAQQRSPGILRAQPQCDCKLRHRTHFAKAGKAQHRRVRLAIEAAWRDIARAEAIDAQRTAIASRTQCVQTLPNLGQAVDMPRRLGARELRTEIARDGVDAEAQEHDSQPVAGERETIETDVLIDEVHADGTTDRFRLAANEGIGELDVGEQRSGKDRGAGHSRPRPCIREGSRQAHPLRPQAHVVRQLDGLLLLEIGRAEEGKDGSVAETGEAEQLAAKQPTPGTERLRAAVLNGEIGISRQVLHRDIAYHAAGRGP